MLIKLLLLLTVVPLIELMILLRLAQWINWQPTIAIVILTGILGAWLARREGLKTFMKIQTDMSKGIPPASAMVDGVLILMAGAFLVTPGIMTDICGFALLIPPIRARIRNRLAQSFKAHIVTPTPHSQQSQPDPFIDVQATSFSVEDDRPPQA